LPFKCDLQRYTAAGLSTSSTCGSLVDVNGDGTLLRCVVPLTTAAGVYTLVHVHPTLGLAGGGANVTVGAAVASIAPSHFGGAGALITLTGAGFSGGGATAVTVDGVACITPVGAADVVGLRTINSVVGLHSCVCTAVYAQLCMHSCADTHSSIAPGLNP
jgi:hypothetical protein